MAVKTSESPRAFAVAKKGRVSLTEIDTRGAEATRKLGRVVSASTDRHTQASTFSSAL
ncbi:FxSxx-COOH cyclophane-containing RiPP peptide [Streptomyces sp. NPDC056178]|uniref:FxSxx-COOH cyclophane-containing RiPP peptide n=1 Tax=unclassified Streptomyces TaxID=2593676 RepID=UPI003328EAD8